MFWKRVVGVWLWLHSSLTPTLDGSEFSTSHPDLSIPEPTGTQWIFGYKVLEPVRASWRRDISCNCRELNTGKNIINGTFYIHTALQHWVEPGTFNRVCVVGWDFLCHTFMNRGDYICLWRELVEEMWLRSVSSRWSGKVFTLALLRVASLPTAR
jgi:hypothetical protein